MVSEGFAHIQAVLNPQVKTRGRDGLKATQLAEQGGQREPSQGLHPTQACYSPAHAEHTAPC